MNLEVSDGLQPPRRHWALLALFLGVTMVVLDGAVANIALPTIARHFGASAADSIWVVNAFQLVVMVLVLALSSLAEIVGYTRIYRIGVVVFGIASVGAALSDSLGMLIVARIFQGMGGACVMAVNPALIRLIFPRAQLGRAIGLNALVVSGASCAGPTVAAGVLAIVSWQWIFLISIPLSIGAFALSGKMPLTKCADRRFDYLSALLTAISFGCIITGLDHLGRGAEYLGRSAVEFTIALVFGTWLVRRQLTQKAPLLPVDLLKLPIFALSICTSVLSFSAQMLTYVTLPFFLQNELGRTAVESGLLMTPWPLAMMIVAPLAGRLADRYPAGILGVLGMAVFATGLTSLAFLPADPAAWQICWRTFVCGVGFALFQSPNNRLVMSSAPADRLGGAGGMIGTARLLGQTIGAALVGIIFNLFHSSGTTLVFGIAAVLALLAMVMSGLRLTGIGQAK